MTELNQMGDNARKAIDHAIDRTSDAVNPAVDQVVAGLHTAVGRLSDVASQVAGKLELTGGQLKDTQSRLATSCRGYVREKPMTSLGIAVASGFLLSWALRQR